jgi:chlorosome envelope protein I
MPRVIINGVECFGEIGESLIDIARRNAIHIGYVFPFTSCRVLKGAEHLSPPSDVEKNWFQPSWLETGHRMADQTTIQGAGPVEILSDAEELRRLSMGIFSPPAGTSSGENAGLLFNNISRTIMSQVFRFPSNVIGATSVAMKARPDLGNLQQMFSDTTRVVQRMSGIGNRPPIAENVPIHEE